MRVNSQSSADMRGVALTGTAFKPFNTSNEKLDLGTTSAKWNNSYISNAAYFGSSALGAIWYNSPEGVLEVGRAGSGTQRVQIGTTRIQPVTNLGMSLGYSNRKWDQLHCDTAYIGKYNKAANGHTTLPNGTIIQWGTFEMVVPKVQWGAASKTIKLPVTFPTRNAAAIATCAWNTSWGNTNSIDRITTATASPSTSEITVLAQTTVVLSADINFSFKWVAIGY